MTVTSLITRQRPATSVSPVLGATGTSNHTELELEDLAYGSPLNAAYDAVPGEALFISALLDLGQYNPGSWGVREVEMARYPQLHALATHYQLHAGMAPPLSLVTSRFASFPYVAGLSPAWAATAVHADHTDRVLRTTLASAASLVATDQHEQAITLMTTGLAGLHQGLPQGVDICDFDALLEGMGAERCPLPPGRLAHVLGGIIPGDFGLIAARLNVGKSWWLAYIATVAAEAGWNVVFASLEMPSFLVMDRIHRLACRTAWRRPWADLEDAHRRALLGAWSERSGRVTIYDPSHRKQGFNASLVASLEAERTVVIWDHIGLSRTIAGVRAISDWRAAAEISNELKEACLTTRMPVIAAAQINRTGASASSGPSPEHLSQTDALGQDADWMVTIAPHSTGSRVMKFAKTRNGPGVGERYYTRYDPAVGNFADITPDQAIALKGADIERDIDFD